MTPPTSWYRRWWVAAAAIVLLLWSQFAWVSPTNFNGFDEWLILWLVSRGILTFPYANRPLLLVWNVPTKLAGNPLVAYYLLHGTYLALTGVLVFLLVRRLARGRRVLAWMAGVFAATWAPRDRLRLDTVQMLAYSGVMVGVLLSLLLLVEWWGRRRWWLLAGGSALALATARGYEGVFPILIGAPLLQALVAPCGTGWRWALLWYGVVGIALAQLLDPLRAASGSLEYQGRVARSLDLDVTHVAGRLLQHYGFELLPLVRTSWRELASPAVLPVLTVWTAAAWGLFGNDGSVRDRRGAAAAMVVGLAFAALGWAMFVPIPSLTTPDRTQFLPAPGIGLFLAAAVVWLASWLPARWRLLGAAALGGWVMWVGTAGVLSLQRQWDTRSAFPGQIRFLRELTRLAPELCPNTLVILLDRTQSWRPFGLRHAVEYMYDGRASGYLWASLPNILYMTRFTDAGVLCEPLPAIRTPWRSPPTLHRYDEVVLVLYAEDRTVTILDDWPDSMYRLPRGAVYAPRARIAQRDLDEGGGSEPRSRAILR